MTTSVAENLEQVRSTILDHADRGGRDPAGVTLVAVTKTVPLARIREAIAAGLSVLGENRVQEALPKIEQLGGAGLEWHLIGHLQRNKVRFIDGAFTMVQSLDSIGLVEALDRRIQAPLQVLLEVNVAEEAQKTGALPGDAEAIVRATAASSRLRLRGLMTIAPQSANPEDVRPVFRRLARLRTELADRLEIALPVLSMGMTDDYGVAVEEGATMLRLGRALFGPR
jgi:pyridoxal phosphate enzyme (YggS family)